MHDRGEPSRDSAPSQPLALRGEELSWRVVEDEVIALDLSRSEYLSVNRSGAALWEALAGEGGARREQLVEILSGRFGREPADAAGEVDAFIAELGARGLIAERE